MLYFYPTQFDEERLIRSLQCALDKYRVLDGRYSDIRTCVISDEVGGVSLEIVRDSPLHLADCTSHLPTSNQNQTKANTYLASKPQVLLPNLEGMDPDTGKPDAPLCKVKVTMFKSGGSCLGLRIQHGVVDGEGMVKFINYWAKLYREPADPQQQADVSSCSISRILPQWVEKPTPPAVPEMSKMHVFPADTPGPPPEFMAVMPKVAGKSCVVLPYPATTLANLKTKYASSADLPEGKFVSTNDILTAIIWKSLTKLRRIQLGEETISAGKVTSLNRAFNARKIIGVETDSIANSAFGVRTEATVEFVLNGSVTELALLLREDIKAYDGSDRVTAWAKCLVYEHNEQKNKLRPMFDADGLSLIVSDWRFPWKEAEFDSPPCNYDHAAIVPIVCTIVEDGGKEGGKNVYHGGTNDIEGFIKAMEAF
ncbi:hypothetical protein TrVE_jg12822 [Triparma verrucosa]|uniref:Uncharacterized protein n=1 Tax=Triparma verrucosa TaxID=1606542 RepID=A0A9W7CNM1_9STRA|nr:hypothetical protein TrVE_jg12822 [Triparma verrucosa]